MTNDLRVMVMAKAPVAGLSKTRLAATIGDDAAADVAAASLLDTLDAATAAVGADRCVLALAGDLSSGARASEIRAALAGWQVIDQRGDGFDERLALAHRDAGPGPLLQIGMDTPQVTPALLHDAAAGLADHTTVLGAADDGGWWVLGRRRPCRDRRPARCGDVDPHDVRRHPRGAARRRVLGGVDGDAARHRRARRCRRRRAARTADPHGSRLDGRRLRPHRDGGSAPMTADETFSDDRTMTSDVSFSTVFAQALLGEPTAVVGLDEHPRVLPDVGVDPRGRRRRPRPARPVPRARPSTSGAGPGRLTAALARRRQVALGIDVVAEAVGQTRERGGSALHRDVYDTVPGEGRWHTALLADGNVGIGGDPVGPAAPGARGHRPARPGGRRGGRTRGREQDRLGDPARPPAPAVGPSAGRCSALDDIPDVAQEAGLAVTRTVPIGARWAVVLEEMR